MEKNSFFNTNCCPYNEEKVRRNIKILQKISKENGDNSIIPKLKKEIFSMLKTVVGKNINNYLKYSRNSSVNEDSLEYLELESNSFIIMNDCIANYNFKYSFYFYFNKSLSVNFYRSFDKKVRHKKKIEDFIDFELFFGKNNRTYSKIDFEFFNIDLNECDRAVIESKIKYEKIDTFLINNPKFNSNNYNQSLKKIKNLLNKMLQNGEI